MSLEMSLFQRHCRSRNTRMRETLCAGIFGEKESFYTLKGLAETVADALNVSFTYEAAERTFLHPYQTAEIFCEGERVGYLGKAFL